MVAELLEAVRAQNDKLAVEPQRVDLAPLLLEDAVSGFAGQAEAKRIRLTAEVQPGLPAVHADPLRVGQVLGNLIDNALKFTPEDGEVRVAARVDGDGVRIEVTDTGPGVPPEAAERVFERLWQADAPTRAPAAGASGSACTSAASWWSGKAAASGSTPIPARAPRSRSPCRLPRPRR
jgi:signal transduction histidine kinase